ncbi:MAG: YkgJ family cysteine cluster protein [Deltaproteobacteria bacterium]|nr:YkgJ family cysteine cluster protein [Deltaproteobacteria bacterium]
MENEINQIWDEYRELTAQADSAFAKVSGDYPEFVTCRAHCTDCCRAVFGVFIVEAINIADHFSQLPPEEQRLALIRAKRSDEEITRIKKKITIDPDDPDKYSLDLANERLDCPLLNDNQECIIYEHRPITCRSYGIPVKVRGKLRACFRNGFLEGQTYPYFNMDGAYQRLHLMTQKMMKLAGNKDVENASLLITMSMAISTPPKDLLIADFI